MARTPSQNPKDAKAAREAKKARAGTTPIVDGDAPEVQPVSKPAVNPAISAASTAPEPRSRSYRADAPLSEEAAAAAKPNADGFLPGAQLSLDQIMNRRKDSKKGKA